MTGNILLFVLCDRLFINAINPIIAYQGLYRAYLFRYHILIIVIRCSNIHSGHETCKKFLYGRRPFFHCVTCEHKNLVVVYSTFLY